MTEAEWLACDQLMDMLHEVRRPKSPWKWSVRKSRLFGCACCRRVWHLFARAQYVPADASEVDPSQHHAIELAEQVADKQAPGRNLLYAVHQAALSIRLGNSPDGSSAFGCSRVSKGGWNFLVDCSPQNEWFCNPGKALCTPAPWGNPSGTANDCRALRYFLEVKELADAEERAQCDLVRDLTGTAPVKPRLEPAWIRANGGAAGKLAQAAYEERELPGGRLDFSRLCVLADALEEAGCADAAILAHLRGPGPHVRGCWVIDLLLSEE
jgi:hypothetical protein